MNLIKGLCLLLAFFLVVLSPQAMAADVTATITNVSEPGQAEDMRIGYNFRYAAYPDAANNMLAHYTFEEFDNKGVAFWWSIYRQGERTTSISLPMTGTTFSGDYSTFAHGKASQKIQVNSLQQPFSIGQSVYEEKIWLKAGREYEFSCYLKHEEAGGIGLGVWVACDGSSTFHEISENFNVGSEWERHALNFTIDEHCGGKGYIVKKGSPRIDILSDGTYWLDSCKLIDVEDTTEWELSKRFIEKIKDLRPAALRWGGFIANWVGKDNVVVTTFSQKQWAES